MLFTNIFLGNGQFRVQYPSATASGSFHAVRFDLNVFGDVQFAIPVYEIEGILEVRICNSVSYIIKLIVLQISFTIGASLSVDIGVLNREELAPGAERGWGIKVIFLLHYIIILILTDIGYNYGIVMGGQFKLTLAGTANVGNAILGVGVTLGIRPGVCFKIFT